MSVCLTFAFVATTLADDEITRRSVKRAVRGKIEKADSTKVVIKPRSGSAIPIPVDDIIRIKYDGEPASLNLARTSELNGALDRALEGFQAAKTKAGTKNKNLAMEIDFLIARTTARQASASSAKLDEAVSMLTDFTSKNTNSIRYFEAVSLLSGLQLQKGDVAAARKSAGILATAPINSLKKSANIIEGRLYLAENKIDEALQAFQKAAAGATDQDAAVKSKGLEGMLGVAMCQQRQQQYDQALKTLDQVLSKTRLTEAAVQAEAYLRRGDVYRAQQKNKEALFEYLHVELLFSAQKSLHAEALFNLAQLWSTNGHPDRAAEAKATLSSEYAGSAWARKLAGG